MIRSNADMARKATKGMQQHPEGGMISVTPEQREAIRNRREKLEWRQEDLAARVPCAPATISNLESGRSKQVKRVVYASVIRALKIGEGSATSNEGNDESFRRIVDGASELDADGLQVVEQMIEALRKKHSGAAK